MTARIIDKKSGSARKAPSDARMSADRPSVFVLKVPPEGVANFTRRGNDLVMVLKDGRTIVIEAFFAKHAEAHQGASEAEAPTHSDASDASAAGSEADRNDLVLEDGEGVADRCRGCI